MENITILFNRLIDLINPQIEMRQSGGGEDLTREIKGDLLYDEYYKKIPELIGLEPVIAKFFGENSQQLMTRFSPTDKATLRVIYHLFYNIVLNEDDNMEVLFNSQRVNDRNTVLLYIVNSDYFPEWIVEILRIYFNILKEYNNDEIDNLLEEQLNKMYFENLVNLFNKLNIKPYSDDLNFKVLNKNTELEKYIEEEGLMDRINKIDRDIDHDRRTITTKYKRILRKFLNVMKKKIGEKKKVGEGKKKKEKKEKSIDELIDDLKNEMSEIEEGNKKNISILMKKNSRKQIEEKVNGLFDEKSSDKNIGKKDLENIQKAVEENRDKYGFIKIEELRDKYVFEMVINKEEDEKKILERKALAETIKYELLNKIKQYQKDTGKKFLIRDNIFQKQYTFMTASMVSGLLYCLKNRYSIVIPLLAISSYWYKIHTILNKTEGVYKNYVDTIHKFLQDKMYIDCFDKVDYRKRMIKELPKNIGEMSKKLRKTFNEMVKTYQLAYYAMVVYEGHSFPNCMETALLNIMYIIYKTNGELPIDKDMSSVIQDADEKGIQKILQDWTKALTTYVRILVGIQFRHPERYEIRSTYNNFIIIMKNTYNLEGIYGINRSDCGNVLKEILGDNLKSEGEEINITQMDIGGIPYNLGLTAEGGHASFSSINEDNRVLINILKMGTGGKTVILTKSVFEYVDNGQLDQEFRKMDLDILDKKNVSMSICEYITNFYPMWIYYNVQYINMFYGNIPRKKKMEIQTKNYVEDMNNIKIITDKYLYTYGFNYTDLLPELDRRMNTLKDGFIYDTPFRKYILINNKHIKIDDVDSNRFRELMMEKNYILTVSIDCLNYTVRDIVRKGQIHQISFKINRNTIFENVNIEGLSKLIINTKDADLQPSVYELIGNSLEQSNGHMFLQFNVIKNYFAKYRENFEIFKKIEDNIVSKEEVFSYSDTIIISDKIGKIDTNLLYIPIEEIRNTKILNLDLKLKDGRMMKLQTYEGYLKCFTFISDLVKSSDIMELNKYYVKKMDNYLVICEHFIEDVPLDENMRLVVIKYSDEENEHKSDKIKFIKTSDYSYIKRIPFTNPNTRYDLLFELKIGDD
jgi:hypothetical protein